MPCLHLPSWLRGYKRINHGETPSPNHGISPWWWRRLVACLITPSPSPEDDMPLEIFPWDDLPIELREVILAKVPLLRLAQLASLCKEFWAAYVHRMVAQVALPDWLEHVTARRVLNLFYAAMSRDIDFEIQPQNRRTKQERGPLCLVERCRGTDIDLLPTWTVDSMQLVYDTLVSTDRTLPRHVIVIVRCLLKDVKAQETFAVSAQMACHLENGPWLKRQFVRCTSLTLICRSGWPNVGDTPSNPSAQLSLPIFLMLCTAMAASVRRVLREVPTKLCMGVQLLREGAIESFTLVLPEGKAVPNEGEEAEGEEAAMCDAITSVLAIIRGKPSGARVATRGGDRDFDFVESSWRLPCVIKRR